MNTIVFIIVFILAPNVIVFAVGFSGLFFLKRGRGVVKMGKRKEEVSSMSNFSCKTTVGTYKIEETVTALYANLK